MRMYSTIWFLFYRIQTKPFLIPLGLSGHRQLFIYCFPPFNLAITAFIHYQYGTTLHTLCHLESEL